MQLIWRLAEQGNGMFKNVDWVWSSTNFTEDNSDLELQMASSGSGIYGPRSWPDPKNSNLFETGTGTGLRYADWLNRLGLRTDWFLSVDLHSGYYHCKTGCEQSMENLPEMQNQLNNAPASFHGNLVRFKKEGTYHYMCTRNNAFSNRAQKADITVTNEIWIPRRPPPVLTQDSEK